MGLEIELGLPCNLVLKGQNDCLLLTYLLIQLELVLKELFGRRLSSLLAVLLRLRVRVSVGCYEQGFLDRKETGALPASRDIWTSSPNHLIKPASFDPRFHKRESGLRRV